MQLMDVGQERNKEKEAAEQISSSYNPSNLNEKKKLIFNGILDF